jgi:uncharacterized repeat protein (TIGR01451 family)
VAATTGSFTHVVTIPLTVLPGQPDFLLSATPTEPTLDVGGSATITIATTALGGLQGPIALGVQGLPIGVDASFGPRQSGGFTTLTLTIDPTAIALVGSLIFGNSPFIVTASSGSVSHVVWLHVNIVNTGDFGQVERGGARVVIISPAGTTLENVTCVLNPDPSGGLPPGTTAADFPVGFFGFEVHGISPGQHVAVKIALSLPPFINQYWKFGSPGLDANGKLLPKQWYQFSYDPITDTGAQIIGNEIILHFVDGQRGDDDLNSDGVIQDPGGPAFVRIADVSSSMRATPDPVGRGRKPTFAMTFTTTLTNRSSIPARGVIVTDPLPAGVAFVSATCTQGTCGFDGSALLWNVGTLAPGASATVRLLVRPIAIGPVTNTAKVSGASIDPSGHDIVATAPASSLPAGRLNRFVTTLYAQILDRFPEPQGEDYWVGRLEFGVGPRRVAAAIFGSREHHWLLRHHLAPHIPLGWSYLVAVRAERWAAHSIAIPRVPG